MFARVSEVKLQPAVTSALGYEPMRLWSLGSNGRVFDDATEQVRLKAVADETARLKDVADAQAEAARMQVIIAQRGPFHALFEGSHILPHLSLAALVEANRWLVVAMGGRPIVLQIVFKALLHGWTAADFHRLCDGVENTFMLAMTDKQVVIGAFTDGKWSSASDFVNVSTMKSFLCQLSPAVKHFSQLPGEGAHTICCGPSRGPTYGGGSDL